MTNWREGTGGCPAVSLMVQNTSHGMRNYRTLKRDEVSPRQILSSKIMRKSKLNFALPIPLPILSPHSPEG